MPAMLIIATYVVNSHWGNQILYHCEDGKYFLTYNLEVKEISEDQALKLLGRELEHS